MRCSRRRWQTGLTSQMVVVLVAGCAGRASGPGSVAAPERHQAYYFARAESRAGNPPRRQDALVAMERTCPHGYRIEIERLPRRDDPQGRGVFEYTCRDDPVNPPR